MTSAKDDREKFIIRFTQKGLREQIAEVAKNSNRSMNAEIINRLFRSFELEAELQRAYAVIDCFVAQPDRSGGAS